MSTLKRCNNSETISYISKKVKTGL
jgi:hypothetical protein